MDGATVNSKEKVSKNWNGVIVFENQVIVTAHTTKHCVNVVYTLSKGEFSVFLTWNDLGSAKYVTEVEIEDTLKEWVCMHCPPSEVQL